MTLEIWRESIFQLSWQQHGGSGLMATLGDVLDLTTSDRDWLLERIGKQRSQEANEISKVNKRR